MESDKKKMIAVIMNIKLLINFISYIFSTILVKGNRVTLVEIHHIGSIQYFRQCDNVYWNRIEPISLISFHDQFWTCLKNV